MNRGALRDGRSTSRARERAFLQVRTATACLFVFGVACLLLGAREAKADNICALGGSVPTGHIIYNITTSASCSGGGTLWQTRVPQNPDWACRPIGLNYPIPGGKIVTQVDLQRRRHRLVHQGRRQQARLPAGLPWRILGIAHAGPHGRAGPHDHRPGPERIPAAA